MSNAYMFVHLASMNIKYRMHTFFLTVGPHEHKPVREDKNVEGRGILGCRIPLQCLRERVTSRKETCGTAGPLSLLAV